MGLLDSFKTSAFGSASKENADDSVKSTFNTSIDSSPPTISTAPRPLQLGSFDFDSSSNGYKYPSLFEEADDMIKLSNLIYTLIELRELARNGKLEGHDKSLQIMELPLPMDRALSIIASEAEVLKRVLSDGAHEEALSALRALVGARLLDSGGNNDVNGSVGANDTDATSSSTVQPFENGTDTVKSESGLFGGLLDMWNNCFPRTVLHDDDDVHNKTTTSVPEYQVSTITAVGDEKCQEELVYVVGVNPATKRITVAFRGSTTKTDFVTDARMDMVRVPGPRAFASQYNMETNNGNHNNSNSNNHNSNHKNSTKTECTDDEMESNICIHQGFYEYLFGSTADNDTSRKQTKFHEIMTHIQTLLDSNPAYRTDYKLYITGHSLGGALATLFGFYASSFHPTLPRPVTVVSVASPRVGNSEFARTFARFESYGDLRHLRIANHKDPVTLGPTVSSKRALTLATMMLSPLGYAALKLSGRDAGAEETYCHTGMKMKLRKEVVGVEGKRCELSYSGKVFLAEKDDGGEGVAKDGDGGGKGDEEEDFGKKSSVSSSLLAAQDVPLVSYHFGGAYAERIALVKDELDGLTLNQLYLEKAAAK